MIASRMGGRDEPDIGMRFDTRLLGEVSRRTITLEAKRARRSSAPGLVTRKLHRTSGHVEAASIFRDAVS